MIESQGPANSRRPRRRWLTWTFTLVGCCALLLRWGWVHYKWHLDELEFREAVEEADLLDPGWGLADLEAARAVVPDADNSAFQVQAAHRLMPKDWLPHPPDGGDCLESVIGDLPPQARLNQKQLNELACELAKVSDAVLAARRLAEMPRGRYRLVWTNGAMFTPLPHLEDVREVSRLLKVDAVRQIQNGNIDEALTSCMAILNAGRSIGDEPGSQWERVYCQQLTVENMERALSQGQACDTALLSIQRLLQDESEQPLLLIVARGNRAISHEFLSVLEAGQLDRASLSWHRSRRSPELEEMLDKKRAHASHGACLKYQTECVEIRKLPLEEQLDHPQRRTCPRAEECTAILEGACASNTDPVVVYGYRVALLRCGLTALAAERYRLVHNRWPDKLEDLVPTILDKILADPFDGQPLRYKLLNDGLVIYSVGVDRKDDSGRLERRKPIFEPGTDVGFQLWNPERRSQPPR